MKHAAALLALFLLVVGGSPARAACSSAHVTGEVMWMDVEKVNGSVQRVTPYVRDADGVSAVPALRVQCDAPLTVSCSSVASFFDCPTQTTSATSGGKTTETTKCTNPNRRGKLMSIDGYLYRSSTDGMFVIGQSMVETYGICL